MKVATRTPLLLTAGSTLTALRKLQHSFPQSPGVRPSIPMIDG
jgi:hypothetical protein